MNILFILGSTREWMSGIWFHRNETPTTALKARGHAVMQVPLDLLSQDNMKWCDVVIFGRTYHPNLQPKESMAAFKKLGKRVLYDMDDDFWNVASHNPSDLVSNAFKDQYEYFTKECDAFITPSVYLGKRIQKIAKGKPVFLAPNGINYDLYKPRAGGNKKLVIGWMGAASHWQDLLIPMDALIELKKKHDFIFVLYGLTAEPIDSAMWVVQKLLQLNYEPAKREMHLVMMKFWDKLKQLEFGHLPFMIPELHPLKLSQANFDIAIAPLEDNEFNRGKSNIKYYEYASVGSPTLASDVLPYNTEVSYLAKNTTKDWYNKLEKLIVDEKFRQELAQKQGDWVKKNRNCNDKDSPLGLDWEIACQQNTKNLTLNQKGWFNIFKK